MRRLLCVGLLVFSLLVVAAAPAAARPIKESGTANEFYGFSSECTTQGTRSSCADTYLDAWESESETFVCVYIERYVIQGERYRSTGWEEGCDAVDPSALTINRDGGVTLSPTTLTLWNSQRSTRDVTVSATALASGASSSETGRGTYKEGGCTYRYTYSSTGSPVEGTLTLDGAASALEGWAGTSTYKTTESCR